MVSLEVADYCEEKKELQEDGDILYGTETPFSFEQCIEEGKEDSKAIVEELKSSSIEAVAGAFNSVSEYGSQTWSVSMSKIRSWLLN